MTYLHYLYLLSSAVLYSNYIIIIAISLLYVLQLLYYCHKLHRSKITGYKNVLLIKTLEGSAKSHVKYYIADENGKAKYVTLLNDFILRIY